MIFSARGMTACLNPAECVRKRSLRVLCAARETGKAKSKRTATSRSHRGAENTNLPVGIREKTRRVARRGAPALLLAASNVSFMIPPVFGVKGQRGKGKGSGSEQIFQATHSFTKPSALLPLPLDPFAPLLLCPSAPLSLAFGPFAPLLLSFFAPLPLCHSPLVPLPLSPILSL